MKKIITVIGAVFVLSMMVNAQKVAVVLSGGGAKGAAHIGVLRALEENQIPINYIAGTSIGAIIGGLYANGWSIDEIENFVVSENFNAIASGAIDEQYIYYFNKPEIDASWASFRFNLDSTITFIAPTNIVSTSRIDYMFMEIFSQANAVCKNNFDSLFVPFRCIGANITQNKGEVFHSGNLAQSIRASMSYPLYFRPVTINGNLYMDGGMFNNFPSDVSVRDFDPDMLIGVRVAAPNAIPDPENLMSQIENIFMVETDYTLPCSGSVLIEPKIPLVGVVDFSKSAQLKDIGYKAAMDKIEEIRRFVTDSVSPDEIKARRKAFNDKKPPFVFDNVQTENLNKYQNKYALNYFNKKDSLKTKEAARKGYYRLVADNQIKSIFPTAYYNNATNHFSLKLNVVKESNFMVKFGGLISSNPMNEAFAEIDYMYLGKRALTLTANTYLGRFYSSGKLAIRMDSRYLVHHSLYAQLIYNQFDYFKTTTRFFEDKNPSYLIENDFHWNVGLIFPAKNKGKVSVAFTDFLYNNEYFQDNLFSRIDIADKTRFRGTKLYAEWERNTLNRKQYANYGTFLNLKLGIVSGDEKTEPGTTNFLHNVYEAKHNYIYSRFIYENYFVQKKIFKLGWYSDLYWSNKDFFGNYSATMLLASEFSPLPEMNALFMPQFRAHSFLGTGFKGIIPMGKMMDFRLEGYIFQPYKEIKIGISNIYPKYGNILSNRYYIASSSIVFHTPIGPLALTISYYDKYNDPWLFSVNFGYLLFNQKAIN